MANLAANPSGSGSIYGQPGQQDDEGVLGVVQQLKDREMKDFRDKAQFMSDLSLRQEARMRELFDPSKQSQQGLPLPERPVVWQNQGGRLHVRGECDRARQSCRPRQGLPVGMPA